MNNSSPQLDSFWNDSVELNDPKYRSPIPCKDGIYCTYPGVCSFWHEGEQGDYRKLCLGRTPEEPAQVRLYRSDGRRADYYYRRIDRLSWPEWCARKGIVIPPKITSLSSNIPSHRRKERIQLVPSVLMNKVVSTPQVQQPVSQVNIQEYYGNLLYSKVDSFLHMPGSQEVLAEYDLLTPTLSTGKLVGMFLESIGNNVEDYNTLLSNDVELSEMMTEAIITLADNYKALRAIEVKKVNPVHVVFKRKPEEKQLLESPFDNCISWGDIC